MKHVYLIIPAFNEARVLGENLKSVLEHGYSVVLIDDCSSDETGKIAAGFGVNVISHPINLGQGAALQTGIEFCLDQQDCDYIVTFDSDGQHDIKDVKPMVQYLVDNELDIVLGSRFLGETLNMPWSRRILLKAAVTFGNFTSGVKLTDAHNGFRVMKKSSASQIQITQNRMAHASEIIEIIRQNGFRFAEHPVTIKYTDYSLAKGQNFFSSIRVFSEIIRQWLMK